MGVVKGSLSFRLATDPAGLQVAEGEVLVVDGRTPFDLGSDLDKPPIRLRETDPVRPIDRDDDHVCLTAHIELFEAGDDFLRDAIPPVLHLRGEAREATTARWLLEELFEEFTCERAGRTAASAQLTQLLFVQVLRAWAAAADELPSGWVRAAADDRLRPALQLMHADVGRDWHISELAAACVNVAEQLCRSVHQDRRRSPSHLPVQMANAPGRTSTGRWIGVDHRTRNVARLPVRKRIQRCFQALVRDRAESIPSARSRNLLSRNGLDSRRDRGACQRNPPQQGAPMRHPNSAGSPPPRLQQ